jgi:NADH dehydrogenase FAD-containing subunit
MRTRFTLFSTLKNTTSQFSNTVARFKQLGDNIRKANFSTSKDESGSFNPLLGIASLAAASGTVWYMMEEKKKCDEKERMHEGKYRKIIPNVNNSDNTNRLKTVVIVGGGVAGHRLAYKLQGQAQVILIDPKTYFEVPMAVPRMMVTPKLGDRAIIPFDSFLPNVTHVQGLATTMTDKSITVQTYTNSAPEMVTIPFDYAILATGASYQDDLLKPHYGTSKERKERMEMVAHDLRDAKKVLIVGGGPAGVEIAGELLEAHPDKKITIIQSKSQLLTDTSLASRTHALNFLQDRKVDIHFEDKVLKTERQGESQIAYTAKGLKVPYDVIIECYGTKPNTQFLEEHFGNKLDANKQVKVTPQLLMEGTKNIFVVGDMTNLDENKMALHTLKHVRVVSNNIKLLTDKASEDEFQPKLNTYTPATGNPMMVVTLGSHNGTAALPFGNTTWQFIINKIKGDMFVDHYRREIGMKHN